MIKSENSVDACLSTPVFAVIPVFNRVRRTLKCIDCLKHQTAQQIHIIVSDGGSTDGTPETIRKQHPDVTVLVKKDLFWGGSTRLGIEWALDHCDNECAHLLMVNNDTVFNDNYVEILVKASKQYNVAIGGVVVDENDQSIILDGGVDFSWETYSFYGRYSAPKQPFDPVQETDVLPGRGTIIPISAIRKAGNVDDRNFPHYISDYEFTYRLKTHGDIGLAVHFDAIIETESPALRPPSTRHPVHQAFDELLSRFRRHSKRNIIDHLKFIELHAPANARRRLQRRYFLSSLKSAAKPAVDWLKANKLVCLAMLPFTALRWIFFACYRLFLAPYLISDADIDRLELDRLKLGQHKITVSSRFPRYRRPNQRKAYLRKHYPEALVLYRRAANPFRKFVRFLDARGYWPSRSNVVTGPYLISDADIDRLELDRLKLGQHKITVSSRFPGYRRPNQRKAYLRKHYPEALVLYRRAANPFRKFVRFLDARGYWPSRSKRIDR